MKSKLQLGLLIGTCAASVGLGTAAVTMSVINHNMIKNQQEGLSDDEIIRLSVARINAAESDAIARQPEIREDLMSYTTQIYKKMYDDKSSVEKVNAISYGAAAFMDAAARQPEIREKLFDELNTNIKYILDNTDDQAIGFGITCGGDYEYAVTKDEDMSLMDAMARQPELLDTLSSKFKTIVYANIKKANNAQSKSIGHVACAAADAMARQPEIVDDIAEALEAAIKQILAE